DSRIDVLGRGEPDRSEFLTGGRFDHGDGVGGRATVAVNPATGPVHRIEDAHRALPTVVSAAAPMTPSARSASISSPGRPRSVRMSAVSAPSAGGALRCGG